MNRPYILGISASHNGAACLLHGDEIVVAIQEERLVRRKRARVYGSRPSLAVRYCLRHAGIEARDLARIVIAGQDPAGAPEQDAGLSPDLRAAAHGVPVQILPHHAAHAISAFATSGWREAAVMVIDGVGSPFEDLDADEQRAVAGSAAPGGRHEAASLYLGRDATLRCVDKHLAPWTGWLRPRGAGMPAFGSLGGMFSAVAQHIFGDPMEAGKVMGLAPYGRPTIPVDRFLAVSGDELVFSEEVPAMFAGAEPWPAREAEHRDLAASVQAALETGVTWLAQRARRLTGLDRLCYAGGVALNSVANELLVRACGFRDVHILPAAEDSGTAIGAAYAGLWAETGGGGRRLRRDSLGRRYGRIDIAHAVAAAPAVRATAPRDVLAEAADRLAAGQILGWFQGGAELGPRALGGRSILMDPRRPDGKAVLNARVKFREPFRPFAPAILRDQVTAWFDVPEELADSPYMLRVLPWRPERVSQVPAVVHADGTGRAQTLTAEDNGRFHELVRAFFARTGVPILLNTSLNVMGEPIVETPDDALWCLLATGLDALVLEDTIVEKRPGYGSVLDLCPRVTARELSLRVPVEPGRPFDLTLDERVTATVEVDTPHGRTTHELRRSALAVALAVLEAIDGRSSGWDLRERLGDSVDERSLLSMLAFLRRTSAITFTDAPAASGRARVAK